MRDREVARNRRLAGALTEKGAVDEDGLLNGNNGGATTT